MAKTSIALAVVLLVVSNVCLGFLHINDDERAELRKPICLESRKGHVFEKKKKLPGLKKRLGVMTREEQSGKVDSDPFKIPSQMDPTNAVGLLEPSDIDLADQCFPKPKCNPSNRYRTIDGSCNNLMFPTWGQANTANTRIIEADYSDGISAPRKAVSGRELPNVRYIRKTLFKDLNKPLPKFNLFLMQFGQLIAHDTELTIGKTADDGSPLQCCNPDGSEPETFPKECLSIKDDQSEAGSSKQCYSSQRATDTADIGCTIKPVRQLIGVTSFIDASMLYGSDDATARSLRTFTDGRLRRQIGPNGKAFLPNVKKASETCNVVNDNTVCYVTGDLRVNQHPDMAVTTISLLRLHNVLCDELKRINPKWNDERLYQEAKRLLIGMYQHVTYMEFFPILAGREYARTNEMLPLCSGFDNEYDPFLNPTTMASFTGAAFRSLHSLIQGYIDLYNEARLITSKIRLSDFYLKTDIIQRKDNYDSFTRGLLTQHGQGSDEYFTSEISEYLFRKPNKTKGMDLVSLDLERGRDYGIPPYNKIRQLCGLKKAQTFGEFTDQMTKKNADALAKVYEHVDDVDFYAAGLLEKLKPGAILGHTFQCIFGEMFYRWKYGDRYFYDFGNQTSSYKIEQVNEIRKTTLALIVCMTSDVKSIQRNAFEVPSSENPLVSCNSIPKLNLDVWREEE